MDTKSLHLTLASAPALAMFHESPEDGARQGTILFYHGFGRSKEDYVTVLSQFAEAGFLVIGVDGIGHGERRYLDFDERFPPIKPSLVGNKEREAAFLSVVRATAHEVPFIIDALVERQWAYPQRIGIAGHSFGGFVTYATLIADKRIQVAAPVVGSPQWKLPWPDSPHFHVDKFFPTALLSQVAGKDSNVLPDYARELHHRLIPYYAQALERLRFIEYPNAPHDLPEDDRKQAWNAVAKWFETFLPHPLGC
ncbi:MAG: alpha/beta fold hydrolase [Ktedonobacteraceae bacterium]